MSSSPRVALLGVTPLSLLLGRACALADNPPVGLYDPDQETALRGALFLGISARREVAQLNPREAPLRIAVVGHAGAAEALAEAQQATPELLALLLEESLPLTSPRQVQAIVQGPLGESFSITAEVPELAFRLVGSQEAREEAHSFLRSLSPSLVTID